MTKIGDIITNEDDIFYAETADWCDQNNAYLEEIEPEGEIRRFKVIAISEPTIEEKNEAIRLQRQARFQQESDPLKLDYDEAVARLNMSSGEDKDLKEKVDLAMKAWLDKKDEIRNDLPYIVEVEE